MPPITSQRIDAPSGKLSVDGNDRIKRAGNLWSAPHRDVAANNSTRAAFKDLLLKIFDKQSLDELPQSVRNALKAGNFDGAGKPLSAHRVSAFKVVSPANTTEE